ncbi:MAG TPA: pyridoxal-phosphate dependent enzyme [Dehalococcoidia bacterium]|nr:pyridoxal-phosphate dependent enzyme [Dehalococcoidia bacterium]
MALCEGPTPVARLAALEKQTGGEIWIKNDGLYGSLYGGNKPRKLEFILADALSGGGGTILTFGAVGTHHGLATALYGRQCGLRVVLLLTYQTPTEDTARHLCLMQEAGALLHYTRSLPETAVLAPYFLLRYSGRWLRQRPYLLWTGASTPLGCAGYVNGALELAEQVRQGQLPEPEHIVVPLASAGTAAGLLLGLRLAGLRSRLLGVAVTRAPTAGGSAVARLAASAARLLRARGAHIPELRLRASDIQVVREWLGDGYAKPSAAGEEARRLLAETEGLSLDPVYTAKTVAALMGLRRRGELGDGPVLYWHTYNALPLPDPDPATRERLPRAFRRFLQPPQPHRDR